ncbi:MAG TPA: WbqC family protein [Chitinophagaceae bacterium]|jgi:hypothetical protein|nr:WbqC family protein [Chitinophagaceae bacterium]
MKLAIMQPYIFPYIGYFQLINAVDTFVIYDNIQYTKKGWINRNRILVNGKDEYFTLPLKKDSDFLNIDQRNLADTFPQDRIKLIRKITEAYRKAPYFDLAFPLVNAIINTEEINLFRFIYRSVVQVCEYAGIKTDIVISSTVNIDHQLRNQDKVMALCQALGADIYINPVGGVELYSKETFKEKNIGLKFIQSTPVEYPQLKHQHVPWLSMIDVMMFNSKEDIQKMLNAYTLK